MKIKNCIHFSLQNNLQIFVIDEFRQHFELLMLI